MTYMYTVIVAMATIKVSPAQVWLLIEAGHYLRAAIIDSVLTTGKHGKCNHIIELLYLTQIIECIATTY